MLYEVLVLLLPLITSPYISRVLGAESLGIHSYTYSIASYFGMVAMLGVKNYGNREIAKVRDDTEKSTQTFWNIYFVQFIVSVVVFFSYIVYVFYFIDEYRLYAIIQTTYVLACMLDISWFFFGLEQFKLTVARSAAVKIFIFGAIFILLHEPDDLWKYCLLISASNFVSQLIMWLYVPRYVTLKKPEAKIAISHIKPMLILFIPVVAISLYSVMDKIMVGILSTKSQLGFYENSEKIIICAKSIITAFGTVMMPRMSKLASDGNIKESKRYMALSIEIVMCIAFAISFGIAAVAHIFAPVFWGQEFTPCGNLLVGLCVAIPVISFANVIRTQYLIPNHRDKEYIVSVIMGAIVNVLANLLLIPKLNAMGAVIGTVFAEVVVCVVQCAYVRKEINIRLYLKKTTSFLLIGFIMWSVLSIINKVAEQSVVWLFIEILIGACIYLLLSVIYFLITKNQIVISLLAKIKC